MAKPEKRQEGKHSFFAVPHRSLSKRFSNVNNEIIRTLFPINLTLGIISSNRGKTIIFLIPTERVAQFVGNRRYRMETFSKQPITKESRHEVRHSVFG